MRRTTFQVLAVGLTAAAALTAPAAAQAEPTAQARDFGSPSQMRIITPKGAQQPPPCTPEIHRSGGSASCSSGAYKTTVRCWLYGPPGGTTFVDGPAVVAPAASGAECPRYYVVNDYSDISLVWTP